MIIMLFCKKEGWTLESWTQRWPPTPLLVTDETTDNRLTALSVVASSTGGGMRCNESEVITGARCGRRGLLLNER